MVIAVGTLVVAAGAITAWWLVPDDTRRPPAGSTGFPARPQPMGVGIGGQRADVGRLGVPAPTMSLPGAATNSETPSFPPPELTSEGKTLELAGRALAFERTTDADKDYANEGFSFLLKDDKSGDTWRILSHGVAGRIPFRMGPTYTGVQVRWDEDPAVRVVGITGFDPEAPTSVRRMFVEPRILTAYIVWVSTGPGRQSEFYVNNWFRKLRGATDQEILRHYVDRTAPYDVYGPIDEQRAPFSKAAQNLIALHTGARIFRGKVRSTKANPFGYEIEVLNLVGPGPGGLTIRYGDEKAIPRLEKGKPARR
jgi:hypothetical protein